MWIAAPLTRIIVINRRKSNTRSDLNPSHVREFMTHTIAVSEEKGSAKDQPSYRMIQGIDAEALLNQGAKNFRLGESELTME
jgi:hypothetical protein